MSERRDIDYDQLKRALHKLNTCSKADSFLPLIEQAFDAIDTLQGDLSVAELQLRPAQDRIEELEAIVRSSDGILQDIVKAAGFQRGEAFSAASIIARLKDGDW